MNWLDYAIIGITFLSMLMGFFRGFVRETLSLIIWLLAFWLGLRFGPSLSVLFEGHVEGSSIRHVLGFLVLFLTTLLLGAIVNFLLGQLVKKTGLSGTDRIFGLGFGLARSLLFVAAVLLIASFTPLKQEDWWQNSWILPQLQGLVTWLGTYVPSQFLH